MSVVAKQKKMFTFKVNSLNSNKENAFQAKIHLCQHNLSILLHPSHDGRGCVAPHRLIAHGSDTVDGRVGDGQIN